MKRIWIGITALLFVGFFVAIVAASQAAKTAVQSSYEMQLQPDSVHDRIMQLRETPVEDGKTRSNGPIILFFVLVFTAAFAIAFLFYGERFIKQFRLTKKALFNNPQRPFYQQYDPSSFSNTPRLPRLPEGENHDQNSQ